MGNFSCLNSHIAKGVYGGELSYTRLQSAGLNRSSDPCTRHAHVLAASNTRADASPTVSARIGNDGFLEQDKTADYQNSFELYCVPQLCTITGTHTSSS